MTEGLSRLLGKPVYIRKVTILQAASRPALRARAPLSLRDISPHCGEVTFSTREPLLYHHCRGGFYIRPQNDRFKLVS